VQSEVKASIYGDEIVRPKKQEIDPSETEANIRLWKHHHHHPFSSREKKKATTLNLIYTDSMPANEHHVIQSI
jgi:hypothetical protein